jgi:hypothetical protein
MSPAETQTFLFVLLAFIAVGYAIAFTRKGKVASATLGARNQELHSPAPPAEVFAKISAIGHPYKVDDRDPNTHALVLSSPVTFFSWGFFYPVFLHAEGTGTRIQIGVHSKLIQMGPVVTNAHNKCVAAIEQALSVPTARVA